jgi:glycosyltransferase involved in cell wall biosynthesis
MSVGVPVVVSKTRIDTYYHSDLTVKFFESEDCEDLARAIVTLQRDPVLRHSLATNAAEYASTHSWGVRQHHYLKVVDVLADAS